MPIVDRRPCGRNCRDIDRRAARKPPGNFPATSLQSPGSFAGGSGGSATELLPVVRRTTQRIADGIAASLPPESRRKITGGQILRVRRGSASPVLNGLRYILLLLANQFVAPVRELIGYRIGALRLFHRIRPNLTTSLPAWLE